MNLPLKWIVLFFVLVASAISSAQPEVWISPMTYTASYSPLKIITFPANYYSWNQRLGIQGSEWGPNQVIQVHIYGPLNTLGVTPTDRLIGTATTSVRGNFVGGTNLDGTPDIVIPYNQTKYPGVVNDRTIPRPGYYQLIVRRARVVSVFDQVVKYISIAPYTLPELINGGWARDRGGRDGWFYTHSPERGDPEWISTWSEQTVGIYATVSPTNDLLAVDDPPANQAAFIAHSDYPNAHFGHDVNMELLPDPEYMWTVGTANFLTETEYVGVGPFKANYGRMECEWEVQNDGSPYTGSYQHGNIGLPLWAIPTPNDRVYMLGRWVLDNGHPDGGDRTEIHPPSLLVTMRKRNTAVQLNPQGAMTRASQVDIYLSGHGGGANMFYDGLSAKLDADSDGGGIIFDLLDVNTLTRYFGWGPGDSTDISILVRLLNFFGNGIVDTSRIMDSAGPTALGWTHGAEFRDINKMDYDFDVPLPVAPPGATRVLLQQVIQPHHATSVQEVITYTHPDANGLPTVAHFHLPCKYRDNQIYAKTFKFYWDAFSTPGDHYVVRIDDVRMGAAPHLGLNGAQTGAYDFPGPLYLWTDICGQWLSLTDANSAGLSQLQTTHGGLNLVPFNESPSNGTHGVYAEVYLDPQDTLRVFTSGYAQRDFDSFFGKNMNDSSYSQGGELAMNTIFGTGDNLNVGGAIIDKPVTNNGVPNTLVGSYIALTQRLKRDDSGHGNEDDPFHSVSGNILPDPIFGVDFTVSYIPHPQRIDVTTVPSDFGRVPFGTSKGYNVQITNRGEQPLIINSITTTAPDFHVSFFTAGTLAPGASATVVLTYAPTTINPSSGTLSINSNDLVTPTLTFAVKGVVGYASIQATADTTTVPNVEVGAKVHRTVSIRNLGNEPLVITPSVVGTGYSLQLPAAYYVNGVIAHPIVIQPGVHEFNTDLEVVFTCTRKGEDFPGTLNLKSNDPLTPTKQLVFHTKGI